MYRALARAIGAARLGAMHTAERVTPVAYERAMVDTAHLISEREQQALLRYADKRLADALSDIDVPAVYGWLEVSRTLHDTLDHPH